MLYEVDIEITMVSHAKQIRSGSKLLITFLGYFKLFTKKLEKIIPEFWRI